MAEWIKNQTTPVIAEKDKVLLKFLDGVKPNALLMPIEELRAFLKSEGLKGLK